MKRSLPVLVLLGCIGAPCLPALARSGVREQIESSLLRAVTGAIGDPSADVTVDSWRPNRPDVLRRARSLESLELLSRRRPFGTVSARVWLGLPRGERQQVFVTAQVAARVDVLVTTGAVERGEPLGPASVAAQTRSLDRLPYGALRAGDPLDGLLAARALAPGQVLSAQLVTRPLLVRQAEDVAVSVTVGGVLVRGRGRALRSGRQGEEIPVRLEQASGPGRVLNAKVDGVGKVRVSR